MMNQNGMVVKCLSKWWRTRERWGVFRQGGGGHTLAPERKRMEATESGLIDLLFGTLPVGPSTFLP